MTEKPNLHIHNPRGENGIVIIFPISKSTPEFKLRWHKLFEIVSNSNPVALVIIDKTENYEASDYFMALNLPPETELDIIKSTLDESMYLTQSRITVDNKLWVTQLHDDDEWHGTIRLPLETAENALVPPIFHLKDTLFRRNRPIKDPYPPKTLFSLLPGYIWNEFVKFIRLLGEPSAPSLDFTLTQITRLLCKVNTNSGLNYEYDDYNWRNRMRATKHKTNLTKADGWGPIASVEIAMFSRAIDGLCSLYFFRDLIASEKLEHEENILLDSFKPSKRKRAYMQILMPTIKLLDLVVSKTIRNNLGIHWNRLVEIRQMHGILQIGWTVKKKEDVILLIQKIRSDFDLLQLEKRFDFWIECLSH